MKSVKIAHGSCRDYGTINTSDKVVAECKMLPKVETTVSSSSSHHYMGGMEEEECRQAWGICVN